MKFFSDNADYNRATSSEPQTIEQPERREWPDPTPEMLDSPEFEAVWNCIKKWDIAVPGAYSGYSGATGNHVRAILDALMAERGRK